MNRLADRTGWAHQAARLYAKDGIVLFAVLLAAGWWWRRRSRDVAGVAGLVGTGAAALAALGVGQVVGHVVDRARPYAVMPGVHVLVSRTSDFSFPSDHATAVGAVAVGLLVCWRPLGWVAAGLAALMAFARVYVGAHYPADVVAGLVLGGATAVIVVSFARRFLTPVLDAALKTPLRRLIVAVPA
jgi:undecaprenyl-diphosphatase